MKERGICKWFNAPKGYGFITRPDGDGDIFVHHSEILADGYRALETGQVVEYEVEQGDKGLSAKNVSVVPA